MQTFWLQELAWILFLFLNVAKMAKVCTRKIDIKVFSVAKSEFSIKDTIYTLWNTIYTI